MNKQFKPKTGGRGIEWADLSINAIAGCVHGCRWLMPDGTWVTCYAKENAETGVAKRAYRQGFEHHYFRPHELRQLAAGSEPKLIFVDSMSDMFAHNVPAEHVVAVLDAMRDAPHHTYQSLTKMAPTLLKYVDHLPPNLWVGVSSPPDEFMGKQLSRHQQEAMLRRSLEVLAEVKRRTGNIVWMSAEPVSWDLTPVITAEHPLDWIVIGAASNGRKYFQPDPEHIRRLLMIMDETKTPVFYKGNIEPMFEAHDLGTPALNRWREDFPAAYRDGRMIPAVIARQRNCIRYGWTRSAGIELDETISPERRVSLPVIEERPVVTMPSKNSRPIMETSAAKNGNTDDKDQNLFQELAKLWQSHHGRGLKVRHLTGARLNDRFGPPSERQVYGKATSQQLSEKLGVAESDLSRMRWFAYHFGSVEELKNKHPDAKNWTTVKTLLAKLRQPQSVPAVKAGRDDKKLAAERSVTRIIGAMQAIRSDARNVGRLTMDSADWKALNEAVGEVLKSVGPCLGVNFSCTPIPEQRREVPEELTGQNDEPTHVDAPDPDQSDRNMALTITPETNCVRAASL